MGDDISDLLSELSRQFKTELRRAADLGDAQPTGFQSEVLAYLGRNPGASPNALAELTGRDRAQITRAVAELEDFGLVMREKSKIDRRSVSVNLTPSGEELFHRVLSKRAALSSAMLETLTQKERTMLVKMLGKMRSGLQSALGS